jgi:hypothetical protein
VRLNADIAGLGEIFALVSPGIMSSEDSLHHHNNRRRHGVSEARDRASGSRLWERSVDRSQWPGGQFRPDMMLAPVLYTDKNPAVAGGVLLSN